MSKPSTVEDECPAHPNHPVVPAPRVSEENGVLAMHFESDYIQSQMLVDDPDYLALAYSRTMMAFELLNPVPLRAAMIGLGGGSMAKWFYNHHPQTELTVVEINPQVIALRDRFHIPQDNHRFCVVCEDGRMFVARHASRFDVLLVDAFGTDRMPPELRTLQFYEDCYNSLTSSGLLVVNLCGKNNRMTHKRIRKCFSDKVLATSDSGGNTVVFACKGALLWPKGETPRSFAGKLKKFEIKHGLRKAMAPLP